MNRTIKALQEKKLNIDSLVIQLKKRLQAFTNEAVRLDEDLGKSRATKIRKRRASMLYYFIHNFFSCLTFTQ